MIQSAMMFALGAFAAGLIALAFCVALVRRTRRISEKRILAALATRRAEFETERDELRARHAVELFRLEKEVSRVLDMATAHRLESDVKDRDLNSLRAELDGRDDEVSDLRERQLEQRDMLQDLERRHAEASTQLRAARHSLKLEVKRRSSLEEALDKAAQANERQKSEMTSLRAENETLRTMLIEYQQDGYTKLIAPSVPSEDALPREPMGASVVPLPTRPRPVPVVPPTIAADAEADMLAIARAAAELNRLTGEAEAELQESWRAPAHLDGSGGELQDDLNSELEISDLTYEVELPGEDPALTPEEQVFDAIAEIRSLKRAASQAGE